jgi:hypothetical protein
MAFGECSSDAKDLYFELLQTFQVVMLIVFGFKLKPSLLPN